MRGLLDRQVLFLGGKGGVGKTTCASALALAASRAGKRTLLVSTDPAHSTSDIFERPIADAFLMLRRRQERVYLDEIETRFSAYERVYVPQRASDVCGLDALEEVSRALMDPGAPL